MDKNFKVKVKDFFRKEGFYIALFLCICIIATVTAISYKVSNKNEVKNEVEQSKDEDQLSLNEDENITVSDVTSTVALVQSQTYDISTSKYKSRQSVFNTDRLSCINLGDNIYSFNVDGDSDLTALQLDVQLNVNDVTPIISLSESITGSHSLKINYIDDSTIRILIFSATSVSLPLNTTIFTLKITSEADVPICINAFASNVNGESKYLKINNYATSINQPINEIFDVTGLYGQILVSNAFGQEITIYTMTGTCVSKHKAVNNNTVINISSGFYIVSIGSYLYKVHVR